jgi:hypothetical protein
MMARYRCDASDCREDVGFNVKEIVVRHIGNIVKERLGRSKGDQNRP